MIADVQPKHDLSPTEINAIEERLYIHNRRATGRDDSRGLAFVMRDEAGRTIGVAAGYSWADTSELKQMWIDEPYRGRGYARELLTAFVAEAANRGVRRIWVGSYDFQAPGMYEKAGFERVAEFPGWPEGHSNVILCKTLIECADTMEWPPGLSAIAAIRMGRPTGRLEAIKRFYVEGLGLPLIGSFEDHDGYDGIIIGLPGAAYHLEFTQTTGAEAEEGQAPTDDNNLVLYFRNPATVATLATKLATMGFPAVRPPNPYWDTHGAVTVANPDDWRVILMPEAPGL